MDCWRFQSWIDSYPLNRHTVLDYFKHSHYYDRECNNERLLVTGNMDMSHLRTLQGVEYDVDAATLPDDVERQPNQPPPDEEFFVVRKRKRLNQNSATVLALYYVIADRSSPEFGTIYPMPDVRSVVNAAVDAAQFHLREAFHHVAKSKRYRVLSGSHWEFEDEATKSDEKKAKDAAAKSGTGTASVVTSHQVHHMRAVNDAIAALRRELDKK